MLTKNQLKNLMILSFICKSEIHEFSYFKEKVDNTIGFIEHGADEELCDLLRIKLMRKHSDIMGSVFLKKYDWQYIPYVDAFLSDNPFNKLKEYIDIKLLSEKEAKHIHELLKRTVEEATKDGN